MTDKQIQLRNKKIEAAAKRCRAAFKKSKVGDWVWCCHHEILLEQLTLPAEERIDYILKFKYVDEQVTRLNNFRPVKGKLPAKFLSEAEHIDLWDDANIKRLIKKFRAIRTLHNKEVPKNTWSGSSIFPKGYIS